MAATRPLALDDAERLAELLAASRGYLAPWDPVRPEEYYTAAGQRAVLARDLAARDRGAMLPLAIADAGGAVCGRINLNNIIRGAMQGATLGYWVSEAHAGRGLASAAVADAIGIAFGELSLHRLEAATLLNNAASQRVLTRNGFRPFAVAEAYLRIAGKWQDHVLFHRFSAAAG
jgi:[ribosomal protein S5]-alanine N-acetyltransferase